MWLAEAAGLHDLLEQRLGPDSPNPVAKATCVIGGMLAGADSIDDLDLLRHGGMGRLFGLVGPPGGASEGRILGELLGRYLVTGNGIPDAQLAALAIEPASRSSPPTPASPASRRSPGSTR